MRSSHATNMNLRREWLVHVEPRICDWSSMWLPRLCFEPTLSLLLRCSFVLLSTNSPPPSLVSVSQQSHTSVAFLFLSLDYPPVYALFLLSNALSAAAH